MKFLLLILVLSQNVFAFQYGPQGSQKLPNGLEVAWFSKAVDPVVDFILEVRGGYRDEPVGKSGLSQILATVITGEIKEAMKSSGGPVGEFSARAEEDRILFNISGLRADSDELLDLLGRIVLYPSLDPNDVRLQGAHLARRWEQMDQYPDLLASVFFRWLTAFGTPYGRGPIFRGSDITSVTSADLTKFHTRFFTPENSILLRIGDAKQAIDLEKLGLFAKWKSQKISREATPYKRFNEELSKRGRILVSRPGASQVHAKFGLILKNIELADRAALQVATALFGGYRSGQLGDVLHRSLGLVYGVRTGISFSDTFGVLMITVTTQGDVVGKVIQEFEKYLKAFKTRTFSEEENKIAKQYIETKFSLEISDPQISASSWLEHRVAQLKQSPIELIRAVTVSDVNRVANKHFGETLKVVLVGDEKEISKGLATDKIQGFQTVKFSDYR